jgi:aminopeptidase N
MRLAIALSTAIITKKLDVLMEKYKITENDEDKLSIIKAMGWLPESELDKVRNLIETGEIKKQYAIDFYISAAFCPNNRIYLLKNFETIVKEISKVYSGTGFAGRVIEIVVPYIGLNKEFEIKDILNKFDNLKLYRRIEKGLEILKIYSKLIRSNI